MIEWVIWDLDDTLWKGTLSENRNISFIKDTWKLIQELDKRGILLSIAMRNDLDEVVE